MDHYRDCPLTGAIAIRERLHADGNRFSVMACYHREQAAFALGLNHLLHNALADKWTCARDLSWRAASMVSSAAGIPEYGDAWDGRLLPHQVYG